jgi:hypothetical protein
MPGAQHLTDLRVLETPFGGQNPPFPDYQHRSHSCARRRIAEAAQRSRLLTQVGIRMCRAVISGTTDLCRVAIKEHKQLFGPISA